MLTRALLALGCFWFSTLVFLGLTIWEWADRQQIVYDVTEPEES